jgi:hypothetical protein
MATAKNKKQVKVRDLKPSKDATGGAARSGHAATATKNSALGGRTGSASGNLGIPGGKFN